MANEVNRLLLVREEGFESELIKSPTRCQRLTIAATMMCEPA